MYIKYNCIDGATKRELDILITAGIYCYVIFVCQPFHYMIVAGVFLKFQVRRDGFYLNTSEENHGSTVLMLVVLHCNDLPTCAVM